MSLIDDLKKEPYRHDMFSVMRQFERAYPDKPRIGDAATRAEEILLMGQNPFVDYPASNIAAFTVDDRKRYRLFTKFLGLLGPQGALPLSITTEVKHWNDMRDDGFSRFLDILNHRFLQLFFRAWADARPIAQHDRPDADHFACYVGAVCGFGIPAFHHRDTVDDRAKLALAGLLGPQAKSTSRIENMIGWLFDVHVEVEQFVGTWLSLPEDDQMKLGARHSGLGVSTMIGSGFYSVQDKFRIHIYVEDLEQFEKFLPSGEICEKLADIIFFYLGEVLDYDVELTLPTKATKPAQIGGFGRLGWTTWMTSQPDPDDTGTRSDARFHPAERAREKNKKQKVATP